MSKVRDEILRELQFWSDEDHDHHEATTKLLGVMCHDNPNVCPALREFNNAINNIILMKQKAGMSLINGLKKVGL